MDKKIVEKAMYLKQDIDNVKYQLRYLNDHSFGFGTSFCDIDDFLRPIAKKYLESKLWNLENKLESL